VPVLFLFVDGVGAGVDDPEVNPLARGEFLLSRFREGAGPSTPLAEPALSLSKGSGRTAGTPLPAGGRAALADACLGVPGRPQSATGQATLLTGENAPAAIGRHLLGFPNAPLRDLLLRRSIFRALAEAGRSATFANAYPVAYLQALGLPCAGEPELTFGRRRPRASATTVAFSAGPGPFRTWSDAQAGRGLTHDITAQRARALGANLPRRTPAQAAELLVGLAAGHDLTLFEFYETDEAGHARSMEQALEVLGRLDAFLRALVAGLPAGWSLVVTSDHGNLEDLSSRNHTLSPVPVLGFGPAAERVEEVRDLTGVAPLLVELAGVPPSVPSSSASTLRSP
jgi:hypothetical protein